MAEKKDVTKEKISLWIDSELLKEIDEKAKWAQRSRSQWIQIELARVLGIMRLLPEYGAKTISEETD